MIDSNATASIDQSVKSPDFFSCLACAAKPYVSYGHCDQFQRAGRCRAVTLANAIDSGRVQIHLHIAPATMPGGDR